MKELLLIAILAVGLIIKDYGYDNRLFEGDRK